MKKTKLKKGDIVCFEWNESELVVGYIGYSDCEMRSVIANHEGTKIYTIRCTPLTKVGKMPKGWL